MFQEYFSDKKNDNLCAKIKFYEKQRHRIGYYPSDFCTPKISAFNIYVVKLILMYRKPVYVSPFTRHYRNAIYYGTFLLKIVP